MTQDHSSPGKLHRQPAAYWVSKGLIAIVVFLNLQAAALFMLQPENYAPGFELGGAAGNAMIQGVGLLFLMWNIPYLVALSDPIRHRVSLLEAIAMQAIGVIGETILWCQLPAGHVMLNSSVTRFILFDAGDLLLLLLSWGISQRFCSSKKLS
jgi:hypothetical protein